MKTFIATVITASLILIGYQAFAVDSETLNASPKSPGTSSSPLSEPQGSESASQPQSSTTSSATPESQASSTQNELAELLTYLVEEEKLARDLYEQLAASSGIRKFSNILQSETQHISSVQSLLQTYGIDDPTTGSEVGEFENSELQSLYNSLLTSGRASTAGAIAAGVAVEETDIADIEKMLQTVLPADVEDVLNQLLTASYRHLSAFQR